MIPRTRLAYFTLYAAGMEAVLLLLQGLLQLAGAARAVDTLSGWTTFIGWVLFILLFVLALRWFRRHVMWSVRNRLIVTYLFIGGVPVTLVAAMAIGTGYVVVEHLATFIAVSEIHAQEQRLAAANAAAVEEIERHQQGLQKKSPLATSPFQGQLISVVSAICRARMAQKMVFPAWSSITASYICGQSTPPKTRDPVMVTSSIPFDQKILARIAGKLGPLTIEDRDLAKEVHSSNRSSRTH